MPVRRRHVDFHQPSRSLSRTSPLRLRTDTATHLKRVLFRDYLRAHPEIAAAYGALKRDLVVSSGGDWHIYTNGKSAFVADVVERARRAKSNTA